MESKREKITGGGYSKWIPKLLLAILIFSSLCWTGASKAPVEKHDNKTEVDEDDNYEFLPNLPYDGLPCDAGQPGGPDFSNTEFDDDYDITDEMLLSTRIFKKGKEVVYEKEEILDSNNPTDKVVFHMSPPSYLNNSEGAQIFYDYEAKDLQKVEVVDHDAPPKLSFYKNQRKVCDVDVTGYSLYDIHWEMTARGFEFEYNCDKDKKIRKLKKGEFDDRDFDMTPEEQKEFDEKWDNMIIQPLPKMPKKA